MRPNPRSQPPSDRAKAVRWELPFLLFLALATALLCLGVATNTLQLGVPGQWTWNYLPSTLPVRLWPFLLPACGLLAIGLAARRIAPRGRAANALALVAIVVLGFLATAQVKGVARGGTTYLMAVVASPRSTSYFIEAERHNDVLRLLRAYPRLMPDMLKHARTHPPGAVLFYRANISLLRRSPGLAAWLREIVVAITGADFDTLRSSLGKIMNRPPPPDADIVAMWVSALVLALLSAAVAIPVYLVLRSEAGPLAGLCGALAWSVVPSALNFTPQVDQLLCFIAAWSIALFYFGVRSGRLWWFAASGACLFLGISVSVGLAALVPLLAMWGVLCRPGGWRKTLMAAAAFAVGFFVPLVGTTLLLGIDWVEIARVALHLHRIEILEASPRQYAPWLLWNVLDLLVFAGIPLTGWWGLHLFRRVRAGFSAWTTLDRLAVAWTVTLLALDLSGATRGETARIWLFLLPPMILAAGEELGQASAKATTSLAASLALCLVQVVVFEIFLSFFFLF
jgi:hypothetical protein